MRSLPATGKSHSKYLPEKKENGVLEDELGEVLI